MPQISCSDIWFNWKKKVVLEHHDPQKSSDLILSQSSKFSSDLTVTSVLIGTSEPGSSGSSCSWMKPTRRESSEENTQKIYYMKTQTIPKVYLMRWLYRFAVGKVSTRRWHRFYAVIFDQNWMKKIISSVLIEKCEPGSSGSSCCWMKLWSKHTKNIIHENTT